MTIGRIPSVEGGIQPTIVDAKGDLIVATAADQVNRLAVGSNDQILVADSTATSGVAWKSYGTPFAAGKNKIINSDFYWNQRNFTSTTANNAYSFDRWQQYNGGTSGTLTVTPQTFTVGTAPVTGYEGKNFVQCVTAAGANTDTYAVYGQKVEDVRTFANQTTTVSFWAKASSGTPKIAIEVVQSFGTGGSPSADVNSAFGTVTLSTSWARYSVTVAVPSISGKTLGTANDSYAGLNLWISAGSNFNTRASSIGLQNNTFQIWGVQWEAGSVATPFQTATGTIQGELAACQRYYWRSTPGSVYSSYGNGMATSTTTAYFNIPFPVTMRTTPSSVDYANIGSGDYNNGVITPNFVGLTAYNGSVSITLQINVASGYTQYRPQQVLNNNNANGYLGFSAEL
jgi:hypothetical protein